MQATRKLPFPCCRAPSLAALLVGHFACASYPTVAATSTATTVVEPQRFHSSNAVTSERRQSRRRYTADNTRGRVSHAKELIDEMKTKDTAGATALFESLMPRDKLDVVRLLHQKRTKRRRDRRTNGLPRYRSPTFERRYYFKESDVTEQSTLGRGPGGQATNRRMQTVILTHLPSRLIVKFSRFPSLWLNRRAARELLNLRLEEKLLGKDSELGRAKAKRERQRRRNLVQRERLVRKGTVLTAQGTQQRDFHAVLTGRSALPQLVTSELGMTERREPLFVRDLFGGGECQNWWPLLSHAFAQCSRQTASSERGEQAERKGGETDAWVADAELPQVLQYLFPLPAEAASHARHFEQTQLLQCRKDEKALANVRRAFRCFCELFGLRLVEKGNEGGGMRVALAKDGLNWVELHRRMLQRDGVHVVPQVQAAWCHVLRSLTALGLTDEAQSVRRFFARECRRTGGKAPVWAEEMVAALRK